ncbi:MAG: hypothetical protein ACE5H0_14415 [Bacteroidota bacterium]
MKSQFLFLSAFALLCMTLLTGCLFVELKEYRFTPTDGNSGSGSITFTNVRSTDEDTMDTTEGDFAAMISDYYEGTQLETENPAFKNIQKTLYEKDGLLVAEITFTFDGLDAVKLYRYDQDSPYMYYLGGDAFDSEELVETNGTYGGENMPLIFWPKNKKSFYFKTRLATSLEGTRSLLPRYREWKQCE